MEKCGAWKCGHGLIVLCVCVTDIDECSINAELCAHGQCINYPGGYRCDCDMGFTGADKERACVGQ